MGYERQSKEKRVVNENVVKETVKQVEAYPTVAMPERKISKKTLERFGVKMAVSEEDGKTIEAVYFPSYNQKGKLVGYKKQDLTLDKSEKYHWTTIGTVSISNKLFGQNVAESVQRKRNNLTQTEGEWDALSCYQAHMDSVKDTKYADMEIFVTSIPMGTVNAVEANLHNEKFITTFDTFTLFYDNDSATPAEAAKGIMKGMEAREAVASAFMGTIDLFTLSAKDGFKDASDMVQAGIGPTLAKMVQFEKQAFSAQKIVHAADISFESLIEKRPEGIYVDEFPDLMHKIHGFRKRELVLVTAPSGVGKSTVCSIIANRFMEEPDERTGMIFLEEQNKETLQRMVASKLKVNYNKFKNDPLSVAKVEDIRVAYDDIVNNDKLIMLGHFGSLPITELMNKIKHMHLVEKCGWIILDHLSVVISGSNVENERKELDMVMTELAAFCAANDVGIIAVSHIKRLDGNEWKPPKGKEDVPFWVQVTKEMMRGSAALEQLSWIIIGVEPQIMPDRSRGDVRLTVLKNRPWSYLGVADQFKVDEDTWEVILADNEY